MYNENISKNKTCGRNFSDMFGIAQFNDFLECMPIYYSKSRRYSSKGLLLSISIIE